MFLRKAVASTSNVSSAPWRSTSSFADDPARRAALAVGGAEGAEVVLAHEAQAAACRIAAMSSVRRIVATPCARAAAHAHHVVPHGVAVDLAARREARVEVGRGLGDVDDRDVRGQDRVEAAQKAVRRDARREAEARDLTVGVPARVGAAAPPHEDVLAQQRAQAVLEHALHGAHARLALPPREVGAVVLDDDAQHAASVRGAHQLACRLVGRGRLVANRFAARVAHEAPLKTRAGGPATTSCRRGAGGPSVPAPRCPRARART